MKTMFYLTEKELEQSCDLLDSLHDIETECTLMLQPTADANRVFHFIGNSFIQCKIY